MIVDKAELKDFFRNFHFSGALSLNCIFNRLIIEHSTVQLYCEVLCGKVGRGLVKGKTNKKRLPLELVDDNDNFI